MTTPTLTEQAIKANREKKLQAAMQTSEDLRIRIVAAQDNPISRDAICIMKAQLLLTEAMELQLRAEGYPYGNLNRVTLMAQSVEKIKAALTVRESYKKL